MSDEQTKQEPVDMARKTNVIGGAIPANEKAHYESLIDCCNKLLDSIDSGIVPNVQIDGLRILLNREHRR